MKNYESRTFTTSIFKSCRNVTKVFFYIYIYKNIAAPPAVQETWVQFLCREDPLEKGMATHSSILALRIPWTEEPDQAIVHGVAKSWTRLSNSHTGEQLLGLRL